jgi:uncharacterized Zn finger protein
MQFKDLTETAIEQFAGPVIFDRGYDYYTNKLVYDLQYDSYTESLQAQVSGHYGDYEVNISMEGSNLSAECTCPYEGYPCKHIVAVLLTFLHNRDAYVKQAQKTKKAESSIVQKLQTLSKEELVELLAAYSKKYPDVKRDLMVRLATDTEMTLSSIKKQITHAFPPVESHQYSPPTIARQLRTILKSVEQASPEMQIRVYWAVIDRTLKELNDYGMDEETLENVATDTMEALVEAFGEIETLKAERAEVIAQLITYYLRGNFGITDWVYDTAVNLCKEKAEYLIIINALEQAMYRGSFTSHYQTEIAELYRAIGDADAERKILEAHLEYGMDYWRLAEYWFEQGNDEKAWEIVHKGLERGQGRKTELYEALQKRYQEQQDYARIFELLQRKLEKQELDSRSLKHDSTYQCLWDYYVQQNDYQGQKHLLEMRLTNNEIDLDFYKQAEKTLTSTDWQSFESQITNTLKKCIQERQQTRYGLYYSPFTASEVTILAEIYHYKNDVDMLFDTIKNNIELLRKYESLLMPHYTLEYLEQYRDKIDRLIAARGRENYKAAVPYAKTIKQIYTNILHKPDEWTQYIDNLRQKNKTLRALQEEFARL